MIGVNDRASRVSTSFGIKGHGSSHQGNSTYIVPQHLLCYHPAFSHCLGVADIGFTESILVSFSQGELLSKLVVLKPDQGSMFVGRNFEFGRTELPTAVEAQKGTAGVLVGEPHYKFIIRFKYVMEPGYMPK